MIFGQLGNDTIQGDGSIDSLDLNGVAVNMYRDSDEDNAAVGAVGPLIPEQPSFETPDDGDDYIEGNGGSDLVFGNLGQDDIIGGSSELYSLDTDEKRSDAGDLLFGGAGLRIDRNEYVESGDANIAIEDRHSRDSDMILGDNGNIFR